MKRITRLTERDITRIVRRAINEQSEDTHTFTTLMNNGTYVEPSTSQVTFKSNGGTKFIKNGNFVQFYFAGPGMNPVNQGTSSGNYMCNTTRVVLNDSNGNREGYFDKSTMELLKSQC